MPISTAAAATASSTFQRTRDRSTRHSPPARVPGVWPPVSINGQRWIDGGMRSAANVDLAAGCERIVVIAPLVRGFRTMPSVARQVAELRSAGRAVVVVSPDQAALAAIGRNVLDPAHRAPAARAGHAQAASVAADVAAVWQETATRP